MFPKFNNSCALGDALASNGSDIVQSLDLDLEVCTTRVTCHGFVVLKDFSGCSTLRSVAEWRKPQSVPKAFRKRSESVPRAFRERSERQMESLLETLIGMIQLDVLSDVESAAEVIVSASSDWTVAMCSESR